MKFREFFRSNWFIIIVLLASSLLMFPNIGQRPIWGDSAWTGLFAENILEYGYPKYWDGDYYITVRFYHDMNSGFPYPMNSWLSQYLAAGSFLIFGKSVLYARIIFAMFGLGTIFMFYLLARKLTEDRTTTRIATILLALSTHIYLYSRNIHYFSLVLFFGTATLYSYIKFIRHEKGGTPYLSISSILLFHSHIQLAAAILLGIVLHFGIFYMRKEDLKRVLIAASLFLIFTVPWMIGVDMIRIVFYSPQYYNLASNMYPSKVMGLVFQLLLSFYYYFLYLIPVIFVFFLPSLMKKRSRFRKELSLLLIVPLTAVVVLIFVSNNAAPGIRRLIVTTLPSFILITGIITGRIYKRSKAIGTLLILILVLTNILHLFPIYLLKFMPHEKFLQVNIDKDPTENSQIQDRFIENTLRLRFPLSDYVYEITHDYVSPDEDILSVMEQFGSKGDTILMNANSRPYKFYGYEPIVQREPFIEQSWKKMERYFINGSKIDWILVRYGDTEFQEFVSEVKDMSKYELFIIKNKDELWIDMPDPHVHRFRTDRNGTIELYHLKE